MEAGRCSNQESENFAATCEAIGAADGEPVLLPQGMPAELPYEKGMPDL